uniref:Uncharacterized protein n=1 Tax=viral metagenome TaxID=1070528 RepID=A0A6C0I7K5_9ZZZZ
MKRLDDRMKSAQLLQKIVGDLGITRYLLNMGRYQQKTSRLGGHFIEACEFPVNEISGYNNVYERCL